MLLEPHDVELFFRLHRTLMFFVNQRLKVISDQLGTPEEFAALSPDVRVKVRDALNANVDLIQAFVDENPAHLQFRESNMHGNPWNRLLRHEVEALVRDKSGQDHLHKKKLQKELADLSKEARKLTTRLKAIERRRAELMKELNG